MSDLTLLLFNWARKDNLYKLLDCLRAQTIKPKVFLWNNNPEPIFPAGIDWLINSSINNHCKSLAFLASQAETEFVGTMDDDLLLTDGKVLKDAIQILASQDDPNRIVGAFGANLIEGKTYAASQHIHIPDHDIPVDLVKGQVMLFRKSAIRSWPALESFHVDLELSIGLAGSKRRRHLLSGCFLNRLVELPADGLGYSDMPTHYQERDAICKNWLSSMAFASPTSVERP